MSQICLKNSCKAFKNDSNVTGYFIFSASPIFFPNNLVFEKLKILKSMNWKNKLFYNNNY